MLLPSVPAWEAVGRGACGDPGDGYADRTRTAGEEEDGDGARNHAFSGRPAATMAPPDRSQACRRLLVQSQRESAAAAGD